MSNLAFVKGPEISRTLSRPDWTKSSIWIKETCWSLWRSVFAKGNCWGSWILPILLPNHSRGLC